MDLRTVHVSRKNIGRATGMRATESHGTVSTTRQGHMRPVEAAYGRLSALHVGREIQHMLPLSGKSLP